MMGRGVLNGGILIGFAPRQDRHTINDEIAGTHEPGVQGLLHVENEEGFMHWSSCRLTEFALLRWTGNV